MTIISNNIEVDKENNRRISSFFKQFRVYEILRRYGADKEKGFALCIVWNFIFSLVFTGRNLYRTIESDTYNGMEKNVVYRFLNNVKIHWEMVLWQISISVISAITPLTSESRKNAIVVDDTPYLRDRSKSVELLSRIYDHCKKTYHNGFRMLTLGWTDGVDFVPFAFQLMTSIDPEKRICEAKEYDSRTIAGRRRKSAQITMPARLLELLKMAKKANIPADYVLFDSWFSTPSALINIRNIGYHVISMLKNGNIKYLYNGEEKTLKQIYRTLKKRPGKSTYLSSTIVHVIDPNGNDNLKVLLIFVRNKNKKNDWKVLLSTDIWLDEEEVIELYGKRWSIEVFFKTCKSYLMMASEYQGRSYDMLVAHSTVVFLRYIMLSWFSRQDTDHRTINEGFYQLCNEIADVSLSDALRYMFAVLQDALAESLWLSDAQVSELLDIFLAKLPSTLRLRLVSHCES